MSVNRPSSQYEYMSLDDFEELLPDKPANEKWELIGGRVVRMKAGVSWEHNYISQNISSAMLDSFRQRGSVCCSFQQSFWLKDEQVDLACFPDVMVRRGRLPPGAKSLRDPVVLVEIVSIASAQPERWALYQRLPSLQHYVLVERDMMAIDVYDRVEGGFFVRPRMSVANDLLRLPAIEFEMSLAEIYRDVLEN